MLLECTVGDRAWGRNWVYNMYTINYAHQLLSVLLILHSRSKSLLFEGEDQCISCAWGLVSTLYLPVSPNWPPLLTALQTSVPGRPGET